MTTDPKIDHIESSAARIRELTAEKTNAENQISDCRDRLAGEQSKFGSLLKQQQTTDNADYLESAKNACRLGVKAWKLSIAVYEGDIRGYDAEIESILEHVPGARIDQ